MPLPHISPWFAQAPLAQNQRHHRGQRGFALLITILLMAFLVLLMVSFASLTRVEIQVAKNQQQLDQARQNALTGLNIALGKLQQYAGPDKAVTARADITSISTLNQPYLTGVWSTSTTSTPDAWLVSGNEVLPTAITPSNALLPQNGTFPVLDDPVTEGQVYVLGTGSVSSLAQGVLLAKQPIKAPSGSVPGVTGAPTTGHYAWWVGDEGIKASASLIDQNLSATPLSYNNSGALPGDDWSSTTDKATIRKRAQLNQLMQPRPVLEKILTIVPPTPDSNDLTSIPKLLTINQLPLLPSASGLTVNAITQKKAVFHDLTALSQGVLANTKTGQLRTDFSPANTGTPALDSYIKLRPDVPAADGTPYVSEFYPRAPSWNGVGAPPWPIFGITPVMTEAAIFFSFDVSGGNLNIKYWLMVELWNPYAATITINPANALKYSVTFPAAISFNVKQYDQATYDDATTSVPPTVPAPKASKVVTINTTTGLELSGTTAGNTIKIPPGRMYTLRGGTTLALSTALVPMGTYSSVPTTLAALDSSPAVYTTVDLQTAVAAGTVYQLKLASDNSLLQSCTVSSVYQTTTGTMISNSVGVGRSCFAFGYTIPNDGNDWYLTGNGTRAWDPRLPVAPAAVTKRYEAVTASSTFWSTAPAVNVSVQPGAIFLETAQVYRDTNANASTRFSPYDLPRQELVSVAELRHMMGPYTSSLATAWSSTAANNLFDQAFFSTVPQNYAWAADGSEPRPNRYLDVFKPFGVGAATLANLRDPNQSARFQLLRGAFNINSTSPAAWKTILGSSSLNWDFPTASPATSASTTTTFNNAFFRTPSGAKEVHYAPGTTIPSVRTSASLAQENLNPNGANRRRFNSVGRQISDTELDRLATRIVTQLQTRGKPFACLADFIGNFTTDSTISPYAQGFLEYAINKTQSDLNTGKGLNGDYITAGAGLNGVECVTQGDVLSKIAPFIAARSDTFIIRTYGDVQNPVTAKIEGRAWCEATVQRVPDLVSDATAPVATVVSPPAASNPFGRRFKIISFRWLSTNDL